MCPEALASTTIHLITSTLSVLFCARQMTITMQSDAWLGRAHATFRGQLMSKLAATAARKWHCCRAVNQSFPAINLPASISVSLFLSALISTTMRTRVSSRKYRAAVMSPIRQTISVWKPFVFGVINHLLLVFHICSSEGFGDDGFTHAYVSSDFVFPACTFSYFEIQFYLSSNDCSTSCDWVSSIYLPNTADINFSKLHPHLGVVTAAVATQKCPG